MAKTYEVIGVMSGSSLDGLDLAHCRLTVDEGNNWSFSIGAAETIAYDEKWRVRLSQLLNQPAHIYPKTDAFFGKYIGIQVREFVARHSLQPQLVASHGHTIFHQPESGFTGQIGSGAYIHAETGLPVVSDLRTVDVALGGQGAPLVPVGDALLFPEYDACLNLGGFANISYHNNESLQAFDIGPCNTVLNRVATRFGKAYDQDGDIAASGTVHMELLDALNDLDFYHLQSAKSLGNEWLDRVFWPIANQYTGINETDLMATFAEHIATQVARTLNSSKAQQVLVTGGGAFNTHLIACMRSKTAAQLVIPDPLIVNFKEALIFALLGVLRLRNEANALKSVTGARRNSTGGALYGNFAALMA